MAEPLIYRSEVVALRFNVSDIANALSQILTFLTVDGDDGEEEADKG